MLNYLRNRRVGGTRCNEGHRGGRGIIGHNWLSHPGLDVGKVAQVPHSADALEEAAALDDPRLGIVNHQGLVNIIGQFFLEIRGAVGEDAAKRRVLFGARDGADREVEVVVQLIQLVDRADVDAAGVLVNHQVVELGNVVVHPREFVAEFLDNVAICGLRGRSREQ